MPDCEDCGTPLTKGNIKVVRPGGKKRPYRIHRRCPQAHSEAIQTVALAGNIESTGSVRQRPQEGTGDPLVAEGVLDFPMPSRYRYFMTQGQADRVKVASERVGTLGIGFEVIPVPEDQVERAPEDYAHLVEVTVRWKDE